ncbi:hypothetical protein MAR_013524 [Mya arenaria]|uniref:Pacifastin domain-containing protein n=1 Tax=Mya arenaria TaxID=6604 RepID=A0ABY7G031_MYAAR|nr:hypothetical protein MAR_013524 [Mya arenaria]
MRSIVVIAVLVILALSVQHGLGHYRRSARPTEPCVDCYFNRVPTGSTYYDGCNECVCNWDTASCTYMYCPPWYNGCFKRRD